MRAANGCTTVLPSIIIEMGIDIHRYICNGWFAGGPFYYGLETRADPLPLLAELIRGVVARLEPVADLAVLLASMD